MKAQKSKVNYTNDHGTSNEQCSKCVRYIKINEKVGACTAVSGHINPGGWCKLFERKKKLSRMVA